jgi:simple sugar transport system permease protein
MQKRVSTITGLKAIRVRIFALFCGLTVIGIFFGFLGIDPIALYVDIFWVNILLFPNTLGRFITLLLISIGLAIPFKARIDNIGAEGQYVVGTLAAFGTSLYFSFLDPVLLIPLMFINGFIIGAIWALPVVFFRAKGGFQGADVVVSFLMVNSGNKQDSRPWRPQDLHSSVRFPFGFLFHFLSNGKHQGTFRRIIPGDDSNQH